MSCWLQAIDLSHIPAIAAFTSVALHVPFNVLFIQILDLGYEGVALATMVFQLSQPIFVCCYVFGTRRGRARVLENMGGKAIGRQGLSFWPEARVAIRSLSGIKKYLSLALPGVVLISEWWASELTTFLAGRLKPFPSVALDAMTIYQCINSFCFMIPLGFGIAGSSRVGVALGKSDPQGAIVASKISIICGAVASACLGSILFFTPHNFIPSFFSSDQDVSSEASRLIPLLAIYVITDGTQAALNGVIKGCGQQALAMPIVLFAYWVVGIPMGYYIAFVIYNGYMCNESYLCGIVGLVSGATLGTCIHCLLLGVVVVFRLDWEVETKRATARMVDTG